MTARALIQVFTEFAPVFAFFIAGQMLPFHHAVGALIVFTLACLALSTWYLGKVPLLPLWSGIVVLITGAITIYFDMPDAIIIADTLYFWIFAGLIGLGFYQKRHFLEKIFSATFAVTEEGWRRLSIRWLYILIIAGFANEYVRLFKTPEFWIDYKFTKVVLITAFACYQFKLARIYRLENESNEWGIRTEKSVSV